MNPQIREHEDTHRENFRLFLLSRWASIMPPPPDTQMLGTVNAQVNHGRWIVECPGVNPSCTGAVMVSREDPMFACVSCGRGWWRVVFPPEKQAITIALLKRSDEDNRNWTPRESLADLERENRGKGIN